MSPCRRANVGIHTVVLVIRLLLIPEFGNPEPIFISFVQPSGDLHFKPAAVEVGAVRINHRPIGGNQQDGSGIVFIVELTRPAGDDRRIVHALDLHRHVIQRTGGDAAMLVPVAVVH